MFVHDSIVWRDSQAKNKIRFFSFLWWGHEIVSRWNCFCHRRKLQFSLADTACTVRQFRSFSCDLHSARYPRLIISIVSCMPVDIQEDHRRSLVETPQKPVNLFLVENSSVGFKLSLTKTKRAIKNRSFMSELIEWNKVPSRFNLSNDRNENSSKLRERVFNLFWRWLLSMASYFSRSTWSP